MCVQSLEAERRRSAEALKLLNVTLAEERARVSALQGDKAAGEKRLQEERVK